MLDALRWRGASAWPALPGSPACHIHKLQMKAAAKCIEMVQKQGSGEFNGGSASVLEPAHSIMSGSELDGR